MGYDAPGRRIRALDGTEKIGDLRVASVFVQHAMFMALSYSPESWTEAVARSVLPAFRELDARTFEEGKRRAA